MVVDSAVGLTASGGIGRTTPECRSRSPTDLVVVLSLFVSRRGRFSTQKRSDRSDS